MCSTNFKALDDFDFWAFFWIGKQLPPSPLLWHKYTVRLHFFVLFLIHLFMFFLIDKNIPSLSIWYEIYKGLHLWLWTFFLELTNNYTFFYGTRRLVYRRVRRVKFFSFSNFFAYWHRAAPVFMARSVRVTYTNVIIFQQNDITDAFMLDFYKVYKKCTSRFP